MVQLTQTLGRPHNCIPSEMELIWDWFSQWSRSQDGALYHNGTLVDTTRAAAEDPSADQPEQPSAGQEVQQYTVVEGDSLWAIAQRFYQDGSRYQDIFQANKERISDPNRIYVGQVLVIPAQ